MAASKNGRAKKSNNRSGKRKNTRKKNVVEGFQTEIILWIILAAAIILLVSAFGFGGIVGNGISHFLFGAVGLLAYLFPIVLFLGSAFLISNKNNRLIVKKILALAVFFVFLCGFTQLLTDGYMMSNTLMDYFENSARYHTGGGMIGGAICISCNSAFGVVGGWVIIIVVMLICLIIITQRSFFGYLNKIGEAFSSLVKSGHDRYMEGQPERELKKEVRTKQKQQHRQEKRAQRMRALEEELATVTELEAELEGELQELEEKDKKVSKLNGFLAGTKLTKERPEDLPEDFDSLMDQIPEIPDEPELLRDVPFFEQEDREAQPISVTAYDAELEPMPMYEPVEEPQSVYEPEPELQPVYEPVAEPQSIYEPESEPKPVYEPVAESQSMYEPEPQPVYESEAMASEKPTQTRSKKPSVEEINTGIRNIQKEISALQPEERTYQYPPLNLMKRGTGNTQGDSSEYLRQTAHKLQETLRNFNVNVTVTNVSCGPTVTRYELQPEMGVKVSKIVNLADDIKLNLATPDIRIEAPIPGKAAVGIEVPNKENSAVMLHDLIASKQFKEAASKLSFAVGKDIAGKTVVTDIAKMPHLLIAGATGSGKSVCINTLIISLLYKASPDEVKLIMVDPKVVELSVYNGIPHLMIPVVTDPKKAAGALNWAVMEMTNRYNAFAELGVRNLAEYNKKIMDIPVAEGAAPQTKMPQIVIIVDELADLMMVAAKEVEDSICRLAQLARAAGIHLIIATQRPSVNVITGLIKANMPSRIAFSVSSGVDSRTILDMNGAEKLLGKGDMLFYPQGHQKPERLQGAFVSDSEVSAIVEYLVSKNPVSIYNTQMEQSLNTNAVSGAGDAGEERDIYFTDAGKFIIEKERASIGMLQRVFKIGFNRAARIMDQLCDAGVVGPEEGTKPRKVLMTMEEFMNYLEG